MEDGGRVWVLSAEEGLVAHMARGECVIGVLSDSDLPPIPDGGYLVEDEESVDAAFAGRVYARFCHKPWIIGENEALILREFVPDDLGELYRLEQDMRSYNDLKGILGTLSDVKWAELSASEQKDLSERFASYIEHQYSFYEFGLWGMFRRSDGKLIGMCGYSTTEEEEMSLGYYVYPTCRLNGYATACCRMALAFAARWLHVETVTARTRRENSASKYILRKLGFSQVREEGGCLLYRKDPTVTEVAEAPEDRPAQILGKHFRRT